MCFTASSSHVIKVSKKDVTSRLTGWNRKISIRKINFSPQSSTRTVRRILFYWVCSLIFDGSIISIVPPNKRATLCHGLEFRPRNYYRPSPRRVLVRNNIFLRRDSTGDSKAERLCFVGVSGPILSRWLLRDNIISRYSRDKCSTNSVRLEDRVGWRSQIVAVQLTSGSLKVADLGKMENRIIQFPRISNFYE